VVICLEQDADLHVAQLIPLPLTSSCFSKIQIDFTFLVPAHPGGPGKRVNKRVCVCAQNNVEYTVQTAPGIQFCKEHFHCVFHWPFFIAVYYIRSRQ